MMCCSVYRMMMVCYSVYRMMCRSVYRMTMCCSVYRMTMCCSVHRNMMSCPIYGTVMCCSVYGMMMRCSACRRLFAGQCGLRRLVATGVPMECSAGGARTTDSCSVRCRPLLYSGVSEQLSPPLGSLPAEL